MARVVVATALGGPEVLQIIDEDVRDPGPGEARIDVHAIGVNPIDAKMYAASAGADPATLPMRLGFEAAGTVTALGPDADGSGLAAGDQVIAFRVTGAYADELVVPTSALVPRPTALGEQEAAGLMLTGATAVHTLTATGVGDGDVVLVHGAAGGVGLMAVQLAGLRGARVIGTASAPNHELLRELGAIPVSYGDGLLERVREAAPEGVDVALDLIGTEEALATSLALVEDRERIATIANFAAGPMGVRVLGGGPGGDPGTELRDAARPELARLAGEGRLRVVVSAAYRLGEVAEAHRRLAGGHAAGKIVLIP